jgi:hypothetical protein
MYEARVGWVRAEMAHLLPRRVQQLGAEISTANLRRRMSSARNAASVDVEKGAGLGRRLARECLIAWLTLCFHYGYYFTPHRDTPDLHKQPLPSTPTCPCHARKHQRHPHAPRTEMLERNSYIYMHLRSSLQSSSQQKC